MKFPIISSGGAAEPDFGILVHQWRKTPLFIPDFENRISALVADDQKLWMGCYVGGTRRGNAKNGGTGWLDRAHNAQTYYVEEGLPSNSVTSLSEFQGRLVAGMCGFSEAGGLAVHDLATDRWIASSGFRVLSLHSAGKKLYVGTDQGIRVYE